MQHEICFDPSVPDYPYQYQICRNDGTYFFNMKLVASRMNRYPYIENDEQSQDKLYYVSIFLNVQTTYIIFTLG